MKKYIPLIAFCLVFASFAGIAQATEADVIPWSGYWWPYQYGGLATGADYRGHPAPIEKYLLRTTGRPDGDLKNWYLAYYYEPGAPGWYGLCPIWARASMMEDYDILPSVEDNQVWRVGDKKGLLTLCHDYGILTNVSGKDPVNLHLWLTDYIGSQGEPFLADLDPSEEVWYYPIYGYKLTSSISGSTRTYRTTIYYASDKVFPDYIGTLQLSEIYTYTLDLNAKGEIVDGHWTGDSVTNHPDTLAYPFSTAPKCPYIDCEEVRSLARAKDDDLETPQNDAVSLTQGTYNLVLLDEDRYILPGTPGDSVYLEISKDDTSTEDVQVVVSDIFGEPVITDTLDYEESIGWTLELDNPPYTLSLTQEDYATKPNIYSVSLTKMAAYRQHVPYIPKSGPWSGFVMVNAGGDAVENLSLVTFDGDGKPIQTLLGPLDLGPYAKQTVIFDDLPWRSHEYGNSDSLMLTADQPLDMLNLFAADQDPMGAFVQGEARGRHLVIPGTVADIAASGNLKGSVLNESFDPAVLTFRMYDTAGVQEDDTVEVEVGPGGKYFYTPGNRPFYHFPRQGWMDIIADEGSVISAYQYAKNAGGKRDAIDTLFALPVETNFLILPHVTPMLGWWRTYLVLINPNDAANPVNLHFAAAGADTGLDMNLDFAPYEKQVMDLSAEYGNLSGAPARSALEITGEQPLVGYFTYSPPYGGDEASFPLMTGDMFQNRLVLPHNAGQDGWSFWTGVCICNPNDYSVDVTVRPYDTSGRFRGDLAETLSIGAGEKAVSTVRSMFGGAAPDISFIVFEADDQAPIGGFYLFGNMIGWKMSVEMLAGDNM